MIRTAQIAAFAGLLSSAAIFGFFYAWVCSTMWGLDTIGPAVAIEAMQAMNASVRNAVFAPAFFGTGPILLFTAVLAWLAGCRPAATTFALGGGLYIVGGMMLTMAVHVPLNEALATVELTQPADVLKEIWAEYSPKWQLWNQIRTAVSGVVVLLAGWGLVLLGRASEA